MPGPGVSAVLKGNPTRDTVQRKSHIRKGLDKKHRAIVSNSNMMCFDVIQALLPCTKGLRCTEERIKSKESGPGLFFLIVPHSIAEQHAQQIALNMEIYMYKISPKFFSSALIKWQLMKKTLSKEAIDTSALRMQSLGLAGAFV